MSFMNQDTPEQITEHGASVVITHRVSEASRAQYEQWLKAIGSLCKASKGLLDHHIIRPIPGLSDTYSIFMRYDTEHHLKQWMESEDRKRLIAEVQGLLIGNDTYHIKSGLDFWFVKEGEKSRVPVRWKQFLITWSAIYPLVIGVPMVLIPLLRWLRIPEHHATDMLLVTATLVFLMVYVVMPRYTRLVRAWLFR
jgi:antibiotic biosynthesis monooxygenase (ABM) superfamily enzyme